jgi:hypothetical protein
VGVVPKFAVKMCLFYGLYGLLTSLSFRVSVRSSSNRSPSVGRVKRWISLVFAAGASGVVSVSFIGFGDPDCAAASAITVDRFDSSKTGSSYSFGVSSDSLNSNREFRSWS